jgi:hypothetical protein
MDPAARTRNAILCECGDQMLQDRYWLSDDATIVLAEWMLAERREAASGGGLPQARGHGASPAS